MPITRIITDLEEARRTVLKRRPLGSEEVPASVAARIRAVFGADLTPGEVVDRILADVQAEGDTALGRYLQHFDGVVPEPLEVPPAEIAAARHQVDDRFGKCCSKRRRESPPTMSTSGATRGWTLVRALARWCGRSNASASIRRAQSGCIRRRC